ncbi:putative metal-dependent hydrolase YfiT [Thalassoglobus neptunius]|uniref:Putative metal-dependent hydrolase YfiT n=1 Tax=Thalassoglobus neptunius TaxID=1938619 RepID=A0A5C5X4Z1_9PLAN|nr:DinB family protein [Thalassoglobus neptunius]TWT57275.1 putative metal-dependent hydrolase YfiT [Thalassoglobus neptunius]
MNAYSQLIDDYLQGSKTLRQAVEGMTASQLDATPVKGTWSSRQVVCHIADFDTVYVDRMKRVIAEDRPPLRGGDPDEFAARLAYQERDVEVDWHFWISEAIRKLRFFESLVLFTLCGSSTQRSARCPRRFEKRTQVT